MLALQSVLFVVVHLLLIKSLLSRESEGKAVIKTKITRLVLVVKLLDLLMKSEELVIVQKFRRNLALQAKEICLCKLSIDAF